MIRIDAREKDLISLIRTKYPEEKIIVESLPLGDCILERTNSPNSNEKIIIERKSVLDLVASIKDGRYNEQSYRLNGNAVHNHNVVYLIEGDVNRLRQAKEKQMVYSAMFSIQYFKGFSLMRTFNMDETATYICNCAAQLDKKDTVLGYYVNASHEREKREDAPTELSSDDDAPIPSVHSASYSSVVKQVKKDNITPENIGEILLCQIPGVSVTCAVAIMKHFKCFVNLMSDLQEQGETCLKVVTWTNAKGQIKKVNKPCCANIVKYLT